MMGFTIHRWWRLINIGLLKTITEYMELQFLNILIFTFEK